MVWTLMIIVGFICVLFFGFLSVLGDLLARGVHAPPVEGESADLAPAHRSHESGEAGTPGLITVGNTDICR